MPDPDPESAAWVGGLTPGSPEHDATVARLLALLRRVTAAEAARRAGTNGLYGRELDDVAEQAADDACVSVLRRLPDFEGRSRFTTWACRFAILEVGQKIARHRWRRDGAALDPEAWEQMPARISTAPEQVAEARILVEAIRRVVATELTPRQRHVFEALFVSGVPIDVLALELGSTRNALYKAEYDVRAKLRKHLLAEGLVSEGEVTR
ncbi:sigma-70 family RNA polymerase sigma factor [Nocardioides acrostichi]|uniref:sigma-70 family RNA polymerase sigma factor n=1 Tax=Nocardioides acrostichi TaxID=2784339 RepID=UPI001A9C967C|nr:sigma-70 family RNA polymerase sigma factor [Nocardioides acrostichi]